jgi:hypothetical protein
MLKLIYSILIYMLLIIQLAGVWHMQFGLHHAIPTCAPLHIRTAYTCASPYLSQIYTSLHTTLTNTNLSFFGCWPGNILYSCITYRNILAGQHICTTLMPSIWCHKLLNINRNNKKMILRFTTISIPPLVSDQLL